VLAISARERGNLGEPMVSTVRLYVDASYATAVMAFVGIVAGFATAGITGDTERSLQVALAMFALTGVVLAIRLWRITRKSRLTADGAAPPEM
jgi:membrane protein implicated in regulation of membrane protease activity